MSTFIALYRGDSVSDAKMVALTADPSTVADFAALLLQAPPDPERDRDPVLKAVESGRRKALRLVKAEAAR